MAKIDLIHLEATKNTVIFNDRDIQSDYIQLYTLPLKDTIEYIHKYGAHNIKIELPVFSIKYYNRVKKIADQCGYSMEYKFEVGHYLNGKIWLKQWYELTKGDLLN